MPEIKKTFLRGRMNKDLDERLLPDGEYRDASNIQISSTEGSDAGTVQNILGNLKLPIDDSAATKTYLNFGDSTVCVGSIADEDEGIVYIFLKGDNANGIVEYNISTKIIRPLIIDNRDNKNLSFSGNKITGICILEGTLFFTDNGAPEPKAIDIRPVVSGNERKYSLFKYYYSLDANKANFTDTTIINNTQFKLEDITVIKKKPRNAPTVSITKLGASDSPNEKNLFEDKFVRFAYRWKFKNNQYSPISQFTEVIFDPNVSATYDLDKGFNNKMLNNISSINLSHFDVSPNYLESVDILYKETNNSNIYIYKTIEDPSTLENNAAITITKESVYSVLPENQLLRHYDNVPYKAKALDAVGNRLVFGNYTDGLNIEATNDYWQPDFNISSTGTRLIDRTAIGGTNESARRTIKQGRTYQLGIVFEDEFGRQTPVLSNDTGLFKRNFGITSESDSPWGRDDGQSTINTGKAFTIKMGGEKPVNTENRITHFKYYIKDTSAEYYNLMVDSVYEDNEDSNFYWIAFPSYEINKIKEDDKIILKRTGYSSWAGGVDGYSVADATVKVLDISESAPVETSVDERKRGVFYVKIRKNTFLKEQVFDAQGTGGNNSTTAITDFITGGLNDKPSNALFIGWNNEKGSRFDYYYKNGEIYEITSNNSQTTDTGSLPDSPANTGAGTISCSGVGSPPTGSTWYKASDDGGYDGGGVPASTLSTFGIGEIWYQINGPAITSVYICYSSSATAPSSDAIFETIPDDNILDIYYETEKSYDIIEFGNEHTLLWYNTFNIGQGMESNRIRDDFNEIYIDSGVKVSTTVDEGFKERKNTSGLIYSGLFNANNGVNNLNQFNTGEKITKNLNVEYGDIQKLFTRNTDIIAFCEEKVLRILANKDALYNADGNVNLTASANVLGQAIAYSGDYGISKNPESFASHGHRAYFTDKSRGAVLRLSQDGLTLISDKGMTAFFRNTLSTESSSIIGSYDVYSDQYILTMTTFGSSISFKEDVDGWPSRLTFLPESGISLEGEYYTCYKGQLYLHNAYGEDRNTFYGIYEPSGIQLIFNQEPSVIKNFKNISYEGTSGWVTETDKTGIIVTDQQDGQIVEFKKKEGKYFGTIHGIDTKLDSISGDELDSRLKDFSIQGLGNLSGTAGLIAFTCSNAGFAIANSNTTTDGTTAITSLSQSTVTAGTIESVVPANMVVGASQYTATITVPDGYSNSGGTITCHDNATGTAVTPTFSCTTANLQINNGAVGADVTGSASVGTVSSYTPNKYQLGSYTYTAVIAAPGSGYTNNSANVSCTGTATGTAVTCGYTLSHNGTYASGGTTITGSSFGSSYGNTDTINLAISSGNICIGGGCTPSATNVDTTKSALAGGLAIVFTEGTELTATTTNGLCSDIKTLTLPQTGFYISGNTTAFTYDSHILTAAHPSTTMTSWQWHKSASDGFTPSNSTLIAGATSSTYEARQSGTGTVYYRVVVNSSNSTQKTVVFSNRTQLSSAKFKAGGTSADLTACESGTTKNIFVKPLNATLQTATEFFSDVEGNKSNLNGTYSMSVSGTNKYRYVNANGTPGDTYTCGTSGEDTVQKIGVRDCRNTLTQDIIVDVTIPVNQNDLEQYDVISFTTDSGGSISGHTYFYVTNASASGTAGATRTWSATHTSCLVADPPTISCTSTSGPLYPTDSITVTANPSHLPQGDSSVGTAASLTYVYRKSTDGSTPTTQLASTTNTSTSDTAGTTAATYKYTVEISGTNPLIKSSVTSNSETIVQLYHLHSLRFTDGSSSIADSACESTTIKNVYARSAPIDDGLGNLKIAGTVTTLYYSADGTSQGSFDDGTYSDGFLHRLFNASGVGQGANWTTCDDPATPTVIIKHENSADPVQNKNPWSPVLLEATVNTAMGQTRTYQWWKTNSTNLLDGEDGQSYSATLTDNERDNLATGSSITHTYNCIVKDGSNTNGYTDANNITVQWTGVEQKVTLVKCNASGTYYARLRNVGANTFNANNILSITEGSSGGIADGCYKVTSTSVVGGETYITTKAGTDWPFQPNSECCGCSSCTVSLTSNATYNTTNSRYERPTDTNVTLTAGATISGFTLATDTNNPIWKWERKEGTGSWIEQSATSGEFNWANDNTPEFKEASGGHYYYKVSAYGTNNGSTAEQSNGIRATSTEYHIYWTDPAESIPRSYSLTPIIESTCATEGTGALTNGRIDGNSDTALGSGGVFKLAGNTETCYAVVNEISNNPNYPIMTQVTASGSTSACDACYNSFQDCDMTMSASQTYTSGGATFTAVIGSSAAAGDDISLEATDGSTVSPDTTTVSALESGLFVTIGSGKFLKATLTSGTCSTTSPVTSATTQAPLASCHQITVYYTTANPATDSNATSDLCGSGPTETRRFNASTLAASTQVYSSRNDCTTLLSGVRYFSFDNTNYHVWNGNSLSGAVALNCPADQE